MNEQILWDTVRENAQHIAIMNREMGGVLTQVSFLTKLFIGQFIFLGTIFVTNLLHLGITKKNGKK